MVIGFDMTETGTTKYMLTTVDNPFNPFTEFDEWLQWDTVAGYNTPSLLARIATYSNDLSEPDQELAIQQAIDEIVRENVSGMFRKVSAESFDQLKQV
jgi:hypothetical protein